MVLSAAQVVTAVNIYHPKHSSSTPYAVLIVAIVLVVFVLIVVSAAAMARASEDRKLAAQHGGPATDPGAS